MYSAHSVGISISSGVSDLGPDGLPKLFNEALLEPVLARRPSSRDGVLGGNFSSTSRPSSRASSARKSRNPIDEADALERYLEKSGTRKEFNLQQYLETTADPPIIPQTTEGMGMNEAMVSYRPSSRGASPSVNTRKLQSKKSASKLIEEIDDLLQNPLYTNDIALNYKSLLLPLRQPKGIRGSLLVQYPSPKQKMVRHTLANSQDPLDDQLMHMMMQQQQYDQQQQQYRQDVYAHPDAQSKYESTEVVGIAGQIQYFPGSSQAVPKLKMNANKVGSFRFINGNIKLLADILQYNGMEHVVGNKEAGLIWCCHHIRGHAISNLPPFHKINIFPHSYECTKKDSLARNINNLIQIHGRRHFSFMPECYVWPQEKDMIKRAMEASSRQQPPTSKSSRKSSTAAQRPAPWILKPAGSSQGKGISILQHFNEISEHIEDEESIYIIERYIHNPLLIQEKKFDLRIYVLVTSFDPLKIYIHKEGLVRRASEKYSYDEETLKNKFCHLTNYSINKKHPGRGAGKQQEGNPGENGGVDDHLDNDGNNDQYGLKMTFADLQTWMHSQGFQDTGKKPYNYY